MIHRRVCLALCLVGSTLLAYGCAKGTDGDVTSPPDPTIPAEEAGSGVFLPPSSRADEGTKTDAAATTDAASQADAPATTDASNDAGPDRDAEAAACKARNNCTASEGLPEVKGDRGADTRTLTGATSQWVKVLVRQPDFGPWSASRVTVALESPAGTNFDLFAYLGSAEAPQPKCRGTVDGSSTSPSSIDSLQFDWPETVGVDDTRWLSIEIRHVSGTCAATTPWKLTVKGNQ